VGGKTLLDGDLSSLFLLLLLLLFLILILWRRVMWVVVFFLLLYWGCVQYNRSVLGEAKSDTIMKINNKL